MPESLIVRVPLAALRLQGCEFRCNGAVSALPPRRRLLDYGKIIRLAAMTLSNLDAFLEENSHSLSSPLAVILAEDDVELDATIAHARALGFSDILLIGETGTLQAAPDLHLIPAPLDTLEDGIEALNIIIAASPEKWIAYWFNAEFLFFPHCETRNIRDAVTFMEEERRTSVFTYAIDLYPRDLGAHRSGVDRESALLDGSGYYGIERFDGPQMLERQFDIFGGLRWRFEEHIPWARRRIDRISLFKAHKGLEIGTDLLLNDPEMNTVSCEWHNNMTMTIMSFRVAKALMHNPGSADAIDSFTWGGSQKFDWSSQQLLEIGFMETGQWF